MGENEHENKTLADVIREGFARQEAEAQAQGEAPVAAETDGGAAPGGNAEAEQAAPGAVTEAPAPEQAAQTVPEIVPQAQPEPAPAQPQGMNMMQYLMERLRAAEQQNAALAAQVQQARGTVQDQSQAAQNALDTAVEQPSVVVPILDINELQYDDDATRAQKMQDWQQAMVRSITDEVNRQNAGKIQPIVEDWENKRRIAEEEAARQTIWGDSRFSDFKDRDEQIRAILGKNPELAQLGPSKSYLVGGMIARGMDYNPNPAPPSPEEIVKMVQNSPEAQKMLDAARAQRIADRNQQIPTIQPSSGMATAAAIPDNTPQSMEDVRRRAAQRFGVQA